MTKGANWSVRYNDQQRSLERHARMAAYMAGLQKRVTSSDGAGGLFA